MGVWGNEQINVLHLSFICRCLFNILGFFFFSVSVSGANVCGCVCVWVTAELS